MLPRINTNCDCQAILFFFLLPLPFLFVSYIFHPPTKKNRWPRPFIVRGRPATALCAHTVHVLCFSLWYALIRRYVPHSKHNWTRVHTARTRMSTGWCAGSARRCQQCRLHTKCFAWIEDQGLETSCSDTVRAIPLIMFDQKFWFSHEMRPGDPNEAPPVWINLYEAQLDSDATNAPAFIARKLFLLFSISLHCRTL